MIDVEDLTRRFGQHVAVDDVSFHVSRGEVVGLLGPNGAGKTTTMRMLTGFLPATSATRLEVAGRDVLRDSLGVRQRIGYLPEAVPLYRELRVEEMLAFHGRLHGMARADLRTRMGEVLERVDLADRRKQLVGNLSRGLRQRVGLAVALLPRPEVLVLDEPTSGLDPLQRRGVRELVRELASEHTVLVSSHILAEIEAMCSRVVVLARGRVVADGTREELESGQGAGTTVRLEAVVGPNVEEARELLSSLPGVESVEVGDRLGIHQGFRITGEGDLREDVGALAAVRGWALRELSTDRRSLEEVFASLVAGDVEGAAPRSAPERPQPSSTSPPSGAEAAVSLPPPSAQDEAPSSGLLSLDVAGPGSTEAPASVSSSTAAPEPSRKVIYSLNPFDRGAERDLRRPVEVDAPPTPSDATTDGASDPEERS